MSGYIELNRTGFAPFDDALSLIEDAGTAYHHTSQWIDDGWNGEKPYLGQINESIAFAAKSYLNLQEQIIELTQQRDLAVEAMREALECGEDGDWQSARRILATAIKESEAK
jgi:hypothetical protein